MFDNSTICPEILKADPAIRFAEIISESEEKFKRSITETLNKNLIDIIIPGPEIQHNAESYMRRNFHKSFTARAITCIAASVAITSACIVFPPVAILTALGATATLFSIAIGGSSLTASLIYVAVRRKEILFEVSLMYTIKKTIKTSTPWYNRITPNIVLGAIPLEGHEKLFQKFNINRKLAMVEDFELENPAVPVVRKENWARFGIQQKQIPTPDFKPVSMENINEGVRYLEEETAKDNIVYVHCKAGRGRSATVVIAYLMKNGFSGDYLDPPFPANSSFKEVYSFVKKRRLVINLNKHQQKAVEQWNEQRLKHQEESH